MRVRSRKTEITHLRVSRPEVNSDFVKVMNAKSDNSSDFATNSRLSLSSFLKRSRRHNPKVSYWH